MHILNLHTRNNRMPLASLKFRRLVYQFHDTQIGHFLSLPLPVHCQADRHISLRLFGIEEVLETGFPL
jgi:hypothetical protein